MNGISKNNSGFRGNVVKAGSADTGADSIVAKTPVPKNDKDIKEAILLLNKLNNLAANNSEIWPSILNHEFISGAVKLCKREASRKAVPAHRAARSPEKILEDREKNRISKQKARASYSPERRKEENEKGKIRMRIARAGTRDI